MKFTIVAAAGVAIFSGPAHGATDSGPCPIVRYMSGNGEIARVINEYEGSTFNTYLARNSQRGKDGVLNSYIKYELSPARWGFDLKTATGVLFAMIHKEGDLWTVNPFIGEKACAGHRVTVRMGVGKAATVFDNGKPIGRVARFPAHEM